MSDSPDARTVTVAWSRVAGWIERYDRRHPATTWAVDAAAVRAASPDGSAASFEIPFPPVEDRTVPGVVAHLARPWTLGVVIVRRGGFAVARVVGGEIFESKVGQRHVQSRTKAGGWSQQRFARRRAGQADRAYAAAAESAYAVLGPVANDLEALVGGGDRSGVEAVLDDRRLAPLRVRLIGRVLPTPDPRLDVLRRFGDTLREVEIRLTDALPSDRRPRLAVEGAEEDER